MDSLKDAGGDTLKMFGLELPLTTVALTSSCSLEERQNVSGKRVPQIAKPVLRGSAARLALHHLVLDPPPRRLRLVRLSASSPATEVLQPSWAIQLLPHERTIKGSDAER